MFKKLYEALVKTNAAIETQYLFYNRMKSRHWWGKALKIAQLNWAYRALRRPSEVIAPLQIRQGVYAQPMWGDMVEQLLCYPVISFDAFDTLLLRAATRPSQVFDAMERGLHIPGFSAARIAGEASARLNREEVRLSDIYRSMPQRFWSVQEQELVFETLFCSASPYWEAIFPALLAAGRRVVVTSDMYLSSQEIRELLRSCGYPDADKIYVSCEQGCNKNQGGLFQTLLDEERVAPEQIIHIGDNYRADVKSPASLGICSYYYRNIHAGGSVYKGIEAQSLCGALYNGALDICLNSGWHRDKSYLFGFCCYGPYYLRFFGRCNDGLAEFQETFLNRLRQCEDGLDDAQRRIRDILSLPFQNSTLTRTNWASLWRGIKDFCRVHPGAQYSVSEAAINQIVEQLYDMINCNGELM